MRGGSDALAPGQPDAPARWRDLRRRAISAAVLAPIALACVWFGGMAFVLLVVAAAVLGVVEWARLCRPRDAFGLLIGGTAWILLAALGLLWVRGDPLVGRANLLFVMLLVWASDIGAYLVGRTVGGPKLASRISPGKTWSGAVGGIAAAVLVGVAADRVFPGHVGFGWIAAVSIVLCMIGQLGDLAESWAKRHFGVKDSGALIPGHGGLLDRLDALLAVAPFVALLALMLGRGVPFWE